MWKGFHVAPYATTPQNTNNHGPKLIVSLFIKSWLRPVGRVSLLGYTWGRVHSTSDPSAYGLDIRTSCSYLTACIVTTNTPEPVLTHWGRVTHICCGNLTSIGSDNGLPPARRQAIVWTNAGILLIGPLGINYNEISIKILAFSFTKMRLKVSSAKWLPFCLVLNVLTH